MTSSSAFLVHTHIPWSPLLYTAFLVFPIHSELSFLYFETSTWCRCTWFIFRKQSLLGFLNRKKKVFLLSCSALFIMNGWKLWHLWKKQNSIQEVYYTTSTCFSLCKSNCFTYVTAISSGDLKMIYFADFLKITENRLISCKKVKSSMIELIHTNSEYLVISVN